MPATTDPRASHPGETITHAIGLLTQARHNQPATGSNLTGAVLAAETALAELAAAGYPHISAPPADQTGPRQQQAHAARLLREAADTLRELQPHDPDKALAVGAAIAQLDHAATLL